MLGFLKGLLGADKVVDSAMRIVDKIAGTDFTSKEKAEFVLNYQRETKHQSPARRFIAIALTCTWVAMVALYIAGLVIEHLLAIDGAAGFSVALKGFMYENLKEPFNYVIMFYFGIAALNGIKK